MIIMIDGAGAKHGAVETHGMRRTAHCASAPFRR